MKSTSLKGDKYFFKENPFISKLGYMFQIEKKKSWQTLRNEGLPMVRLEKAEKRLESFGPWATSGLEKEIPTYSVQSPESVSNGHIWQWLTVEACPTTKCLYHSLPHFWKVEQRVNFCFSGPPLEFRWKDLLLRVFRFQMKSSSIRSNENKQGFSRNLKVPEARVKILQPENILKVQFKLFSFSPL